MTVDRFDEFELWAKSAVPTRWLTLGAPDAKEIVAAVEKRLAEKSDEIRALKLAHDRQSAADRKRLERMDARLCEMIDCASWSSRLRRLSTSNPRPGRRAFECRLTSTAT